MDSPMSLPSHAYFLVYKHSPWCGLSARARREVERFRRERADVPVVEVDVIHERALSDDLEARLGVRHESPQVILVVGGRPRWHASHGRVTADAIASAIVTHLDGGAS